MKRAVFAFLYLLCLVSCAKDDDVEIMPTDGQYVCNALDAYFSVVLSNGRCIEFTTYTQGEYFGSWRGNEITTTGKYPHYKYRVGEFCIDAKFSSLDNFGAILNGTLHTGGDGLCIEKFLAIQTSDPVQFYLYKKELDTNGGL